MHPRNDTFPPPPALGCGPPWDTRHLLLKASHLLLAAAFLVPATNSSVFVQFAVRLLLGLGFLSCALWAGLASCTGPDVLAWQAALLVANCAQAAWLAYGSLPPRIPPELQDLYARVFAPLRVDRGAYRQLVRLAHLESLDANERYAIEGVTNTDQRLAVLLSGRMKVTCEDTLLHFLLPTEFVDSPEWESCASNTDKRFQVTLTATEPCQLLCWGRRELLSLLESNPFLNVVMYNLIGKDITHKLYSLNEQHYRTAEVAVKSATLMDLWRTPGPIGRTQSVDMVNTGLGGHVRSLFWKKPERKRRDTILLIPEHLGDSLSSNFSDPGPRQNKKKTKASFEESKYETPV
ncbi:hypothetical protein JTE90_009396 [Oedothorax gibbosus]|uniref:POPDC1-3 domain-containing protein n=1 Tax=Oedothorax gibbosus TaxID=931172 RepID=A0AAV6VSR0_9ARAC|nr:hypothetical protein JTE90_009396 [Oedothorax gibbosus]